MDNQEAIDVLQEKISPCVAGKWKEAVDVAISALQAQDVPEINVGGTVSRRAAIDALMDEFKRVPTTAIRAKNRIDRLPPAQPNLQPTCNQLATVAKDKNVPCKDIISRQDAIDAIVNTVSEIGLHDNSEVARYGATFRQHEIIDIIEGMPSAQLEIIRCKDCTYGVQDEYGRWYCRSLGCQIGDEDGNGFCSDAERRADGKD